MSGAGTAIGELPPYFMARAARLSGAEPDDEEYQEFEEMLEHAETAQDFASRAKLAVQNLVQKVGFFGILACASIPNPLFDLAGITCGHFLCIGKTPLLSVPAPCRKHSGVYLWECCPLFPGVVSHFWCSQSVLLKGLDFGEGLFHFFPANSESYWMF
uniref:Uncharacterized protein n=1 Tax=Pavo cristatus TaxID=9049 RepID=A0A8C9G4J5_PAVCR